jgi:hypothetical protein
MANKLYDISNELLKIHGRPVNEARQGNRKQRQLYLSFARPDARPRNHPVAAPQLFPTA